MRPATILCGAALAALSACSTYDPNHTLNPPNPDPMPSTSMPAQGTVVAPVAGAPATPATVIVVPAAATYRSGFGTVQAVQVVQQPVAAAPSPSAGATTAPLGAYRLTVRMEDGSTQVVDQSNPNFRVGDRVQLTTDGRIVRG